MTTTDDLETQIAGELAQSGLGNASLHLERVSDGRRFRAAVGAVASNPAWRTFTSSCAKPVMLAVIIDLIAQGVLDWRTKVADVLPAWAENASGAQLDTELWHLLSYSSGMTADPSPPVWQHAVGSQSWAAYVVNVCDLPTVNNPAVVPGQQHTYSTTQLDVAAVMAVTAAGALDWIEVFNAWRASTGLLAAATWVTSPQVSITFTASREIDVTTSEYLDFLAWVRAQPATQVVARSRSDLVWTVPGPQRISQLLTQQQLPAEEWRWVQGMWWQSDTAEPDTRSERLSTVGLAGQYATVRPAWSAYMTRQTSGQGTMSGALYVRSLETLIDQWAEAV